jgi:hypothetical protein
MDVSQEISEVENSLRNFVLNVLENRFGSDWLDECGISARKVDRWRQLREQEAERQRGGTVEERLLYYSNLSELKIILTQNWPGEFEEALGNRRTIEVFIDELIKLRDPNAHNRELLPHQKHLVLGLSGEIRNRLIRYRSKMETGEDYYPRLESVRDNVGNVWVAEGHSYGTIFATGDRLRPGDSLEFVVSATDPLGQPLSYGINLIHRGGLRWQDENVLSVTMTTADVRRMCDANIYVRSPRDYHALEDYDDIITFRYEVLPPRP